MNCDLARHLLPLAASGDLAGDELHQLQRHCDHCPACTAKLKGLQATLLALSDAGPTATVQVDVAAIYRAEAERQARSIRLWRRAALGLGAAAAFLLGLFGLTRLEVRWDAQQLVIRWGTPPVDEQKSAAGVVALAPAGVTSTDDVKTGMNRLKDVVLALVEDMQGMDSQLSHQQRRDHQTSAVLVQLAKQIEELRQEGRRDRAGLYAALNAQTTPEKE